MTGLLRHPAHQEDTIPIPPLKAAIYLPTDLAERDLATWRERCINHCVAMGYDIEVVVTGPAAAWQQLQDDLRDGDIQIVVVGRREHLPPQRLPRIEESGVEAAGPIDLAPMRQRARRRTWQRPQR